MGALRDASKHWWRRMAVGQAPRLYWRTRFALRGYEEPELALLPQLCRPGSVVIDVGANFGMYTYWLTRLGCRCVAFEPIPRLAQALARGFGQRIELHAVALSDQKGSAELVVPHVSPGLSTIEPSNALREQALVKAESFQVRKVPLDDFAFDGVSFIKIDVEGHEEAVLRGAKCLLARERPSLLLELEERHNPGCVERVKHMLSGYGLEGAVMHGDHLVRLADYDLQRQSNGQSQHLRNFIFARPEVLSGLTRG